MNLTNFGLNKKQLRFFNRYIEEGNAARAYMKVYRLKNTASASVCSSRLISQFPDIKRAFYEQVNLGISVTMKALKDALGADRQIVLNDQVYTFPDHRARLKAVKFILKH